MFAGGRAGLSFSNPSEDPSRSEDFYPNRWVLPPVVSHPEAHPGEDAKSTTAVAQVETSQFWRMRSMRYRRVLTWTGRAFSPFSERPDCRNMTSTVEQSGAAAISGGRNNVRPIHPGQRVRR